MKIEKGFKVKKELKENKKNGFKKDCPDCGNKFRATWSGLGNPKLKCNSCTDAFMKRMMKNV